MGIKKILRKAQDNPGSLRFEEFCLLIEHYGGVKRKGAGSHVVFKRHNPPVFTQSVQSHQGMAKAYQVRQFMEILEQLGLRGQHHG